MLFILQQCFFIITLEKYVPKKISIIDVVYYKKIKGCNNSLINAYNQSTSGTGWMVGPYLTGRFGNTSVSYDLRAAYGQSDNDVKPENGDKETFETTREMVSGALSGVLNS